MYTRWDIFGTPEILAQRFLAKGILGRPLDELDDDEWAATCMFGSRPSSWASPATSTATTSRSAGLPEFAYGAGFRRRVA